MQHIPVGSLFESGEVSNVRKSPLQLQLRKVLRDFVKNSEQCLRVIGNAPEYQREAVAGDSVFMHHLDRAERNTADLQRFIENS